MDITVYVSVNIQGGDKPLHIDKCNFHRYTHAVEFIPLIPLSALCSFTKKNDTLS